MEHADEPLGSCVGQRLAACTALTTVNIAVLAPMPSASVSSATIVKLGDRARRRRPWRMSWRRVSMSLFLAICVPGPHRAARTNAREYRQELQGRGNDRARVVSGGGINRPVPGHQSSAVGLTPGLPSPELKLGPTYQADCPS